MLLINIAKAIIFFILFSGLILLFPHIPNPFALVAVTSVFYGLNGFAGDVATEILMEQFDEGQ